MEQTKEQIINDYLELQCEFLEETIAEANVELIKGQNYAWQRTKEESEAKLVFLRELQRRERNGL